MKKVAAFLDVENIMRAGSAFSDQKAHDVFEALIASVRRDGEIAHLRGYGKPGDRVVAAVRDLTLVDRYWVHVEVADGDDMADDVLVNDLELYHGGRVVPRYVVCSGDGRILHVAERLHGTAPGSVRVIFNGYHSRERCHSGTYPGIADGHRHVLDLYDEVMRAEKCASTPGRGTPGRGAPGGRGFRPGPPRNGQHGFTQNLRDAREPISIAEIATELAAALTAAELGGVAEKVVARLGELPAAVQRSMTETFWSMYETRFNEVKDHADPRYAD